MLVAKFAVEWDLVMIKNPLFRVVWKNSATWS